MMASLVVMEAFISSSPRVTCMRLIGKEERDILVFIIFFITIIHLKTVSWMISVMELFIAQIYLEVAWLRFELPFRALI